MEQIVDRVRGEPELRERSRVRRGRRRPARESERALGVERRLGRADVRDRARHADEPVAVEGIEGPGGVIAGSDHDETGPGHLRPARDRPLGISDPVAPRPDVEGGGTSGVREPEHELRGRDAPNRSTPRSRRSRLVSRARPRRRRTAARSASGAQQPAVRGDRRSDRQVARAGYVPRDGIDRLALPAEALGRPHVDQHAALGERRPRPPRRAAACHRARREITRNRGCPSPVRSRAGHRRPPTRRSRRRARGRRRWPKYRSSHQARAAGPGGVAAAYTTTGRCGRHAGRPHRRTERIGVGQRVATAVPRAGRRGRDRGRRTRRPGCGRLRYSAWPEGPPSVQRTSSNVAASKRYDRCRQVRGGDQNVGHRAVSKQTLWHREWLRATLRAR